MLLKNLHIYNASMSTYPTSSLLEFTAFAARCEFKDANVTLAVMDREFIAVNFEVNKDE